MQQALLRIMQVAGETMARYTAGRAERHRGPRDLDEMVPVPAVPFLMGSDKAT